MDREVSVTNFPKAGDDKVVSLRNSSFARFDVAYAETLRGTSLWGSDDAFAVLCRVARQGGTAKTRAEEKALRLRERWAAKNYKVRDLANVVAQIKWLVVGEQGEAAMKNAIKDKDNERAASAAASGASGSGEARDAGTGTERRGGNASTGPVYVQRAVVRSVRREGRPTGANPDRKVVVVDFVASTEIEDSHETIIRSNWNLKRYTANPVLLWMHGRMNDFPAIGNVEMLKRAGTTHEGTAVFDDTTQLDRDVADKYEKGVLKGFSIGFYPNTVQFERIDGEDVLVLDDIELLEISCVNVPSNPEALARSGETGWDRAIAGMSADLRAYEALHARATAALHQTRGTPTTKPHGDTTMKTLEIQERDIRASNKGVQCEAACPNCKEAMMVKMDHVPMPTEKAAEMDALNTRAVAAEKRIAEETARAAEITAKLTSAETRAAAFETQLSETRALVIQTRVDGAKSALEARSGKKLFAPEVESELELARMYLADLTPDATDKTRTVGEIKWAKRLAVLDARPEMTLLAPPASTGTNAEKPREEDPAVRDAASGAPVPTSNKAAEDLLSFMRSTNYNRPGAPTATA